MSMKVKVISGWYAEKFENEMQDFLDTLDYRDTINSIRFSTSTNDNIDTMYSALITYVDNH